MVWGTLDQEVTSSRWQEVEVTGQRSEEVEESTRKKSNGSDGS